MSDWSSDLCSSDLLVLLRKIADAPVDNGTVDHALPEAFADLASQFQRPPVNFRSAVGHQNAPHAAAMMPKPMRVFSPRPACQASSRSASEPESTNGATMPTNTPDPARTEERRVGKECVSTYSTRGSP